MYLPHGKYPKGFRFNVLMMTPGLFKNIELSDFAKTLGTNRFFDLISSQQFLFSSQYQENYGTKLVMLLSAVERANGRWKSLQSVLRSRKFARQLRVVKNGEQAFTLLGTTIKDYNSNFGSIRRVVNFYKENLNKEEKLRIIRSIRVAHFYEKKQVKDALVLEPKLAKRSALSTKTQINRELGKVLKNLVYEIRNAFVHNAMYIPFPDRKYLRDKKLFVFVKSRGGIPKESWVITMPFENLHELTVSAFVKYWRKEYKVKKED